MEWDGNQGKKTAGHKATEKEGTRGPVAGGGRKEEGKKEEESK